MFYIKSLAGQERKGKLKSLIKPPYKNKYIIQTVSEIELINLTELEELSDPSHKVLDLNQINITYRNLFCENRLHTNQVTDNHKNQFKVKKDSLNILKQTSINLH